MGKHWAQTVDERLEQLFDEISKTQEMHYRLADEVHGKAVSAEPLKVGDRVIAKGTIAVYYIIAIHDNYAWCEFPGHYKTISLDDLERI